MKQDDPGLWPTILVFSPALSYLAWSQGFENVLLSLSAAFVLLGIYICSTGKPAQWKRHAPYMLLSGLIQFVLIVPMTGFVAHRQIDQMAGSTTSIVGAVITSDLPIPSRPW